MFYSNFSLEEAKEKFNLKTIENIAIFSDVEPINSSNLLEQ